MGRERWAQLASVRRDGTWQGDGLGRLARRRVLQLASFPRRGAARECREGERGRRRYRPCLGALLTHAPFPPSPLPRHPSIRRRLRGLLVQIGLARAQAVQVARGGPLARAAGPRQPYGVQPREPGCDARQLLWPARPEGQQVRRPPPLLLLLLPCSRSYRLAGWAGRRLEMGTARRLTNELLPPDLSCLPTLALALQTNVVLAHRPPQRGLPGPRLYPGPAGPLCA